MSLNILSQIELAPYTSWLIGGKAEFFCLPQSEDELIEAVKYAFKNNLSVCVLGGGSNVLVSDLGVQGLTICLKYFKKFSTAAINNRLQIEIEAGAAKSELLKIFLKNKLAPALFLAGLPGDIGGGVVMNAGVTESFTPREFMDFVDEIEVIDFSGQVKVFRKKDLTCVYRHTTGWQPGIVSKVKISWPLEIDESILEKVKLANRTRLSKQPLDKPSCGSVFKNPEGLKAAQLIDQCGLKGFRIGDAQVSEKHANFIVNLGQSTAIDTWNLILHVQKTVQNQKNVSLTTEVVRLGHWN